MDFIDKYLKKLEDEPEFRELLALKKKIDSEYGNLIVSMKTKEAKYLEMKEYEKYRSDVNKYKLEFMEAKRLLYSKEEVKRYFELERKIQNMINEDINELKESISNKFTLTKNIF